MPSMPEMPGKPMSSSATSGGSRPNGSRASSIEPKRWAQRYPSVPSIRKARPSRNSRWSSMMATRIGDPGCCGLLVIRAWVQPVQSKSIVPLVPSPTQVIVASVRGRPIERYLEDDGDTPVEFPRHVEAAAQYLCPPLHAEQTVAIAHRAVGRIWREPPAVVIQPQHELSSLDPKIADDAGGSGVANDVVDAFLENQEHLTSHVRIEPHFRIDAGSIEMEVNIPTAKHLAGELPHALGQAPQPVFARTDGPDDVAHRVDQFARHRTNSQQRLVQPLPIGRQVQAGDFTGGDLA